MNVFIIILASINFVYLLYYIVKMTQRKPLRKTITASKNNQFNNMIKDINKKPLGLRAVSIVTILFASILTLVITTSFAWLPLLMWKIYTLRFGILTFITLLFLFSIFWSSHIASKKENIYDSQEAIIRESISMLFFFQIGFIIYFASEPSLINMMNFIYSNAYFFNNTFTILFPIILISSIVLNIYIYIQDIRIKTSKKRNWILKWIDILLIFVASSFIGLLYLSEVDTPFITNPDKFKQTKDIVSMFLSAVLIPLVFNKVNNSKSSKKNNILE